MYGTDGKMKGGKRPYKLGDNNILFRQCFNKEQNLTWVEAERESLFCILTHGNNSIVH
jgi:hypothetical protein